MARLQELLTQSTVQNLGLGQVLAVRAQEAQQLRDVMNEQAKAQVEAVKAQARSRRETGETLGALVGAGIGAFAGGEGNRLQGASLGAGIGQAVGGQASGAVRQPGVTTGADIAGQALQAGAKFEQKRELLKQEKALKEQELDTKKLEANQKIAQGLLEKGFATPEEAQAFSTTGDFSAISKKTGGAALTPKEKATAEGTIRKEFQNLTKDFRVIRDSFSRVQASGEDPSAAGDLALIFNYMKILDPGSVVRESEFANAANSAGVPERIRAQYNRVLSGERLSDVQRNDFLDRSKRLFDTRKEQFDQTESEYTGLSKRLGLRPENIILKSGRPLIQKKRQQEREDRAKLKKSKEKTFGGIKEEDLTQEEKDALKAAGLR